MSFVCVLSCVVSGGGPDIVLTIHTYREVRHLCVCLVFWSIVCCFPYRHVTLCHLDCKSRGFKPYSVLTTSQACQLTVKLDRYNVVYIFGFIPELFTWSQSLVYVTSGNLWHDYMHISPGSCLHLGRAN